MGQQGTLYKTQFLAALLSKEGKCSLSFLMLRHLNERNPLSSTALTLGVGIANNGLVTKKKRNKIFSFFLAKRF